ncbi:MAG TPA: DegV family EDD domain-containing protein, partial [Candidatus Omnitrophica bacterium]|nr:DegV family EDD domain-containing protein [Candidatus Omnitrophota bacterium]
MTFKGALRRIHEGTERGIGTLAKRVADGFLIEAKGNSGVIFSQFLLGFSQALEGKIKINVQEFALAMRQAIKKTYNSIEKPKEGTILTVIRETAEEAEKVAKKDNNFISVLERALRRARESLERTKEILPSLKKAGVVDAGGLGFVLFFEGLVDALRGRKTKLPDVEIEDIGKHAHISAEELEHRYCTEAVIEGEKIDGNKLKNLLKTLGSSLIVVGAGKLFHIHIHTNRPQKVLSILKEKGRLLREKVDDMLAQNIRASRKTIGIITDSTSDMPLDLALECGIEVVPQQIIINNESYRDGIDITREKVMEKLVLDENARLTTSQASPQDFITAYKKSAEISKALIVLTVSSGLSGTIKSAEIAAGNVDIPVYVIDTKRISFAEALIALRASEKAKEGWSA